MKAGSEKKANIVWEALSGMNCFQRYLFGNVLRMMITIVGGLVAVALLTQGLTKLDLIVENRQSALTFLYVSALAAPQVVSLLLPFALFIAATASLNRSHRESEIVVAQASGMSRFGLASPILRIAAIAAVLQLGINLWVQPLASREMRETVSSARSDLAATLIKPGEFNFPADNLTIFVADSEGGELKDVLFADNRDPAGTAYYIAQTGALTEVDGVPAILMRDGRVQQRDENGRLSDLSFDQYPFELSAFMRNDSAFVLKSSDRFLPELFRPDLTNYYDNANKDKFMAEGHARIASPLLNLVMGMLAIVAVLGGQHSRRGYQRRIAVCSAIAVTLQLTALATTSAGEGDPDLNILQYIVPICAFALMSYIFFFRTRLPVARGANQHAGAAA